MPLFSRGKPDPKRQNQDPSPPKKPARTSPQSQAPQLELPGNQAPRLERRATDNAEDGNAVQARLREDLNELLTAHRHQGRVLERNQKLLEQAEQELAQLRTRSAAL